MKTELKYEQFVFCQWTKHELNVFLMIDPWEAFSDDVKAAILVFRSQKRHFSVEWFSID